MKRTIPEIKAWLQAVDTLSPEELQELLTDDRVGVRKLAESYQREQARKQKERERVAKMWQYERECWSNGLTLVAGVDEAGRGPLAGPVVAAAVILPPTFDATGLNDSKQLSEEMRTVLKQRIEQEALAVGVGIVDAAHIDKHNILQATYHAMRIALSQLTPSPQAILADAVKIPGVDIPQQGIVKGDSLSHSIAAASIIAKTTRDEWMKRAAQMYPAYGFEQHMGYGTPEHLEALRRFGPTPLHRRSFAPVREVIENSGVQGTLFAEGSIR
ncbi:RNase HII [Laceyella tengchongensis]|uniref:Ribonuclease HII n=1 Tax=Laceyella tengchongensis TaxID=574699 RepID=A0AA45WL43_9BACL|nr:ribonuclease HII [Laceyella tengchongensis]SMP09676.1 RNase HII [Laceyella tengchongensis]